MSFIVSAACVRLKCPGVAKNVLMQLADIANDHGYAWPSIETLCMRTDWGRTAVIDAINWLEQHKALSPDRTNGRKTLYRLTPAAFEGERYPEKDFDPSAKRTGPPNVPVRQTDSTRPPNGPDPSAKRTLISKNHQEPSIPPTPDGGERGFASLVAEYPKKVDLADAEKVFRELAPDAALLASMIDAVRLWVQTDEWQRERGRYVPKLAKWLRKRRWLDVPGFTPAPPPPAPSPPKEPERTPEELARNREIADAALAKARAAVRLPRGKAMAA